MAWYQIVFMQGEDAAEALGVLEEHGNELAITYLRQWENGDEEKRDVPPWGGDDTVYASQNNSKPCAGAYYLSYNLRLGYIGLTRIK